MGQDRQLQLPLPLDLYPVLSRRSGTEVERDNRAIHNLMQRFGLTEKEATESYLNRTEHEHPKKGALPLDTDNEVNCAVGVHKRPPAGPSQWRNNATKMWHYHCADCGKPLTSPDPPEKGS
ncbi:MAG: hypothetical protein HYS88_01455 [Candidatus Colwellbacteria bacterium]|nr:hypothetical protein [Candidatus Colwellbacteria bacterium]